MRKSGKCEACGKGYKFPAYIKEDDIRYRFCRHCEFVTSIIDGIMHEMVNQTIARSSKSLPYVEQLYNALGHVEGFDEIIKLIKKRNEKNKE